VTTKGMLLNGNTTSNFNLFGGYHQFWLHPPSKLFSQPGTKH